MRLAYVSSGLGPHDLRFLSLFLSAGFEPVFVSTRDAVAAGDVPPGVRHIAADAVPLDEILRHAAVDAVVAGPVPTNGLLAARAGVRPLFLLSWGFDLLRDVRIDAAAAQAACEALRAADALVCDCDAVRDAALALGGIAADRCIGLPWGLEASLRDWAGRPAPFRAQPGWQDGFIVLCVRAWESIYRPDTVLDGFARAHAANPDLRLVLAGDGAMAPQLRARIQSLGLARAVHCPGRLSRHALMAAYAAADAYVSASEVDGTSVSLLEAMASRRAVVVSDIPGNREWVEPGRNGLLFPVGDAALLAQALLDVAALPDAVRSGWGEQGRAQVLLRADWERNAAAFTELLRRAAGGTRAGTGRTISPRS
ncbi:MAG: glycosyltransferase [Pseudomonadota bacterium]